MTKTTATFDPDNLDHIRALDDQWERAWYIDRLVKKALDETKEDFQKEMNDLYPPGTPEEEEATRARIRASISPFDTDIRIGEVRMLSHKYCSENEDVPEVVVMAQYQNQYIIVPFSPFDVVGVYTEVQLRNTKEVDYFTWQHNVVQCENARIINEEQLKESWLCTTLDAYNYVRIKHMFDYLCGGTLPENLDYDYGKELLTQGEPRHLYMCEQYNRFPALHSCCGNDYVKFGLSKEIVSKNPRT